jgi:hypothetical protein
MKVKFLIAGIPMVTCGSRAHGEQLKVDTKEGEGAEFTVEIPV